MRLSSTQNHTHQDWDSNKVPILLKGASDVVFLTELSVLTKLFYADAMTWFGVTTG